MVSIIVTIFAVVLRVWRRSFLHWKRVERAKAVYASEGVTFPSETIAAVDSSMAFHSDSFVASAESDSLKEERKSLLEDYQSALFSPLKFGATLFCILLPVEIAAIFLLRN